MEYDLMTEINHLNTVIRSKNHEVTEGVLTEKPSRVPSDSNTVISSVTVLPGAPADPQPAGNGTSLQATRFSRCGLLSDFRSEDWYKSLSDAGSRLNLNTKEATSACYSPGNDLLILLFPGVGECDPGAAYRFMTDSATLTKATMQFHDESCAPMSETFGRRNGDVISMKNKVTIRDCALTFDHEYNFVENRVTLKKSSRLCPGDPKTLTIEY
jgi:hypothetical protein